MRSSVTVHYYCILHQMCRTMYDTGSHVCVRVTSNDYCLYDNILAYIEYVCFHAEKESGEGSLVTSPSSRQASMEDVLLSHAYT